MKEPQADFSKITKPGSVRRKVLSVSQSSLIKIDYPQSGRTLPLVIQCRVDGVDLVAWATNNRELIQTYLLKYGGILLRNFDVQLAAEFERFIKACSGELLEYHDRATPRTHVTGNIYTSTDYPADQRIELHNESSYACKWPLKILFFCSTPAQQGGETPIADCRKVFERIPAKIRQRFIQKKLMYLRNFGSGLGLPWETVFQTTKRVVVEEYCSAAGIKVEWRDGSSLRTREVRPAVATHPLTGEVVWFNQATSFHVSTIEPAIRKALLTEYKEEEIPKNVYYGDGSPLEPFALDIIRNAYLEETIAFPWQKGDILMLDNMLMAHGRAPFVGPRKVFVGMSESSSWENA